MGSWHKIGVVSQNISITYRIVNGCDVYRSHGVNVVVCAIVLARVDLFVMRDGDKSGMAMIQKPDLEELLIDSHLSFRQERI